MEVIPFLLSFRELNLSFPVLILRPALLPLSKSLFVKLDLQFSSGFHRSIQLDSLFVFHLTAAIAPRRYNSDFKVVLYGSNC